MDGKTKAWRAALMVGASLLTGCVALGPLPARRQAVADDWANRARLPNAPGTDLAIWWTAFADPALDALVARALAQNLSLAQAGYRLQAARALVRPASAQRLPRVDTRSAAQRQHRLAGPGSDGEALGPMAGDTAQSGSAQPAQDGRSSGQYQAGFDAAWEIDLFGRASAAVDSARAGMHMALAETRMARVAVVAEVVRAYIELRSAQRQRQLLADNAQDQDRLVALIRERRAAGIASDFDVERSVTAAAEIAAQIPLSAQAMQQSAQRIAVLTGEATVDHGLLAEGAQPVAQRLSLHLLPADLVRTRPEIQRAEHAVAQASAELGVSIAELYPRLTLIGDIVASGNLVGTPLPGRAQIASAGLSITLPLLDWGARRAVVSARESALAEAIAGYRQAVLEGIEETENALDALDVARRRSAQLGIQVQAARRAARHAGLLHQRGLASLSDRLDAAIVLRQAELLAVDATEKQALAVVALHKAVGGASLDLEESRSR